MKKRNVTRAGVCFDGIWYNNATLSEHLGKLVLVEKQGDSLIVRSEQGYFICMAESDFGE